MFIAIAIVGALLAFNVGFVAGATWKGLWKDRAE